MTLKYEYIDVLMSWEVLHLPSKAAWIINTDKIDVIVE